MPAAPKAKAASWLDSILRMVLIYMVLNMAVNHFAPKTKVSNTARSNVIEGDLQSSGSVRMKEPSAMESLFTGSGKKVPVFDTHDEAGNRYGPHKNIVPIGSRMDMFVYITEHKRFNYTRDSSHLTWTIPDISYSADYQPNPLPELDLNLTVAMLPGLRNGSAYAHVFCSFRGQTVDTYDDGPAATFDSDLLHTRFDLIEMKEKKKIKVLKKLLEAKDPSDSGTVADAPDVLLSKEQANTPVVVPYFKPSLVISFILDIPENFQRNTMPSVISQGMKFAPNGDFFPVIYHHDFWLLASNMIEVNDSVSEVPLHLGLQPLSFWQWHLQTQMQDQWKSQKKLGTGGTDKETDMLREMLLETNPWLLGVTFAVSILHMLFDMLAFKNDIQFWRKKKSMEGMSIRSLSIGCFFQTIIFLYLMDNDTSYMILMSSGMGLAIEYWKLNKAFNFGLVWGGKELKVEKQLETGDATNSGDSNEDSSADIANAPSVELSTTSVSELASSQELAVDIPCPVVTIKLPYPLPSITYCISASYAETETSKHDTQATTHLLYLCYPLAAGYALYSLFHLSHKSFYSWALGSLVGFVYAFGFVLMTPQLWINYKLKSVAHMPWKAMVYKSLNTFIDDLFAFVIKMPTMHRIACFRDDLIFFIYLYQRWAYVTDYTRTNEFGQEGPEAEADEATPEAETNEITKKD